MSTTRPLPTTPAQAPRRRRRWPWVVASLGVLGAAGYAAAALTLGSKTASDTTVGGVQVGGMTHAEALDALRTGLQDKAKAKVPVAFGEQQANLDPATAGLSVDYAASVDGLTGASFNPVALYDRLTGSVERDPVLAVDDGKLTAALTEIAETIAVEPKNARLVVKDGKAVVTDAVDGVAADVAKTADAVTTGWLKVGKINGALTAQEADVTTEEAESAKREVADKVLSGPVTISVDGKDFPLAADAIGKTLSFTETNGDLAPSYDEKALVKAVRAAGTKAGVLKEAKDAVVSSANGSFHVEPSVDGLDVDADAVTAAVEKAAVSDDRVATVAAKAAPAKFTTKEAKDSLPTGVISTFTTHFPYAPDRTHNITLAAKRLNGAYVAPGETFSLNAWLGQRTPEKGYRGAPVIYNGRLTKDYGGGISQVSTTLFNAIFFSGAQIDQYTPHSFYISRYPEGREATISWPNVDNRFTNTTKGGILIQASVGPDSITVTFKGKKTWDIEATKGPRTNITKPQRIEDDKEDCVPQSPNDGFDVTVGRVFKQGGKVVKTDYLTTHYIPEDLVICTHPNAGQ